MASCDIAVSAPPNYITVAAGRAEREPRQAFERALALKPGFAEAALNLGRPPQDLWTEIHQQYLPDKPMLAPPNSEHSLNGYLGSTPHKTYLKAFTGPLLHARRFHAFYKQIAGGYVPILIIVIPPLAMALALALLFLVPRREVTLAASPRHWIWQVLIPGSSPAWRLLGGAVLLGWSYSIVQIALTAKFHTPFFLTAIVVPNIQRAYGVPLETSAMRPSFLWLYLAPTILFTVNFLLVWRSRERRD